jgi:hypothetical protein
VEILDFEPAFGRKGRFPEDLALDQTGKFGYISWFPAEYLVGNALRTGRFGPAGPNFVFLRAVASVQ